MPEKQHLWDMVFAGIAGSVTSYLVNLQKDRVKTLRDTVLHFAVGAATIFPAWLAAEYLALDSLTAMIVGYVFGVLGDKIIAEIYRQQSAFFDALTGGKARLTDKPCDKE